MLVDRSQDRRSGQKRKKRTNRQRDESPGEIRETETDFLSTE